MQRRTIWIIVGVVAALGLLICVMVGTGGFLAMRELQRQQNQLIEQNATLVAGEARATVLPASAQVLPATAAPTATPPPPTSPPATAEVSPAEPTSAAPAGSVPTPYAGPLPDFAAALAPESRAALAQRPDVTLYRIGARLDPQQQTIAGEQVVRLTNGEGVALDAIYFRLYPNAPHYGTGGLAVEDVRVGGQPVETRLELDDTALRIALPAPLAQGQSVEISMRFTTTVPDSGGYGIFSLSDGVFALYNWHPELAVHEGGDWLLNPVVAQGDPTNTDASNYVVAFAAPDGYEVITSGVEQEPASADGQVVYQAIGALTRNFVVVASDQFQQVSQQVGPVVVNSYYLAGSEDGGKTTLATAARAVELFSRQFGPYAYPELDVTQVQLGGGAAGMELTGLIMIGSDYYDPHEANPLAGIGSMIEGAEELNLLEFVTAHEAAHQWWYGVVGSDAYKQPWLDELLTNWSSAFYVDEVHGADTGLLARDVFIRLAYQAALADGDDRLDQPVDTFSSEEYAGVVYGKGALMYDVLRKELGDEQFFEFLRRYYQQHQFGRADGEAWRAALAQVSGEETASAFHRKWIEGADIGPTDLPPGGPMSDLFGGFDGLENLFPTETPGN